MQEHAEIKEVLARLKKKLGIKRELDLANFLGVKPSTLSTWKKRNSMDYGLVIHKCLNDGIELNKLFVHEQKKYIGPNFELHAEQGHAEIFIDRRTEKAERVKELIQDLKNEAQDNDHKILTAVFSIIKELKISRIEIEMNS